MTLNGRRDGAYNSTVEAWDAGAWAWYGYQMSVEGDGHVTIGSGNGEESEELSFASYINPSPGFHEVETIDSQASGISIRMYDFDSQGQIASIVGGNNYIRGDYYNNSSLASMELDEDGFPYFEETGKSASELFTESNYKGSATNLFLKSVYESTGYYEYSSFHNYAMYQAQSAGQVKPFNVYQEIAAPANDNRYFYKRGNFYPYNAITSTLAPYTNQYDGGGNLLSDDDPTKGGTLYKTDGKNDFFGMIIDFSFMQPKGGYNRGGAMVYEFNGDDDLWVYIDGVKILDIGGVHDALPGTINFATGVITYGENMYISGAPDVPKTIKECFERAGVFPDGTAWDDSKVEDYFRGDTFVDYGSHSFQMFYMEQGAGASNLEVRFNLPVIEKKQFTVEKVLEGISQTEYANVSFAFQAFQKDGEIYVPLTEALYEGTEVSVPFDESVVINGKTYTNVFYLKPGEAATFQVPGEDVPYYVQELGIGKDFYDEVMVNDVTITGQDTSGIDGVYRSSEATVQNRVRLSYENHCSEQNRNDLEITKLLEEGGEDDGTTFEFRRLLENAHGELVP